MAAIDIGVLIDLAEDQAYYVATLAALDHAADALGLHVRANVIRTDRLGDGTHLPYAAVVVGPGSPYREPEAVLAAIRSAREHNVPLVGT